MTPHRPHGSKLSHKSQYDLPKDERESFLKALPADFGQNDGFRGRVTPMSKWHVTELDFWADPRKDEQWALEMIATIGMARFQREFLRNWSMSTQSPFFPEYISRGGDNFFVRDFTSLGSGPFAIGLDFGFRRPAAVAMQANPRKTRLFLLREWMPQDISGRAFMEVVEWLIGEMDDQRLSPEALKHVADLRRASDEGRGPAVPWFRNLREGGRQVLRYAGQEAIRTSQEVADESQERRIHDLWASAGFPLNLWVAPVKARELVVRHLLRLPPKGAQPFLVVERHCKILRDGFNGGYTFRRPTRENPQPDQPAKDGYYDNIMDAMMYAAANLIDVRRIDVGGADEDAAAPAPAEAPKPKPLGSYSRGEKKDDKSAGFSSPFGVSDEGLGVYRREEWS